LLPKAVMTPVSPLRVASGGRPGRPRPSSMREGISHMADPQQRVSSGDVERAILQLRGVISARVVTDERANITEIHVVADQTRAPKQLSRDIESVLLSELDIRVDHRKVSIAQLRGKEVPEPLPEVRLKFLGIEYAIDRVSARARVLVGRGEDNFIGVATTAVGPQLHQEQLVARAAVAAVEEFVRSTSQSDGAADLELSDFSLSNGSARPFVMVTVRISGATGEESLIGSALVRDDPWRAAACAVLDAVNRRLPSMLA
jgi:hypothetical protein